MQNFFSAFILLLLLTVSLAHAQDDGVPDSSYYHSIEFYPGGCANEVTAIATIYLSSDQYSDFYIVRLAIEGGAEFDTAEVFLYYPCEEPEYGFYLSEARDTCDFGVFCIGEGVAPVNEVIAEVYIKATPGETFTITAESPHYVKLGNTFGFWIPTFLDLDTEIVTPSSFVVGSGDADASGNVAITDAVFIISYIFGGGCGPFDLNAADPDQSCVVSIADAVYLINYIFGGGPAPLPGCVVE